MTLLPTSPGTAQPGGRDAAPVTYSGRGLQGRLVESLGPRIIGGELAPGEVIDLDALGAHETVSRTVVREAVKVLVGKGLLDARPRHGTFVRDRAAWNLLDPDVMRWRSATRPDRRLLSELDQVRRTLEPVSARLAAERRTDAHVRALEDAFASMQAADHTAAQVDADLGFHWAVASASGNELLERLTTLLEPAQRTRDVVAFHHHPGDTAYLPVHEAVLHAIRDRDPEAAEAAMHALLEAAGRDIEAAITDPAG